MRLVSASMIASASAGFVGTGGGAADHDRGLIMPQQILGDAIGQAAYLAHFAVEPRREAAAARM